MSVADFLFIYFILIISEIYVYDFIVFNNIILPEYYNGSEIFHPKKTN